MLVEMFRNRGELAPSLLRRCAGIELSYARAEQGSIDLSQVAPTEYRADAVTILRDADNGVKAAVIVEVQLRIDRHKEYSWPVYVTALYAKLHCPVILLVVVPDSQVGTWARAGISIGHPGFVLTPIVQEIGDVPEIPQLPEVGTLPELAVLSAMAHPTLQCIDAALNLISVLPEEQYRLYSEVITATIWELPSSSLESIMDANEFERRYPATFALYCRAVALIAGLRRAVQLLLEAKLPELPEEYRAAFEEIRTVHALEDLISVLSKTSTPSEVCAALIAARTQSLAEREAIRGLFPLPP
jgi:hypothetical protein